MTSGRTQAYGEKGEPLRVERRQPASFRRQIRAVKEGVRIETVASVYGEFRLLASGRLLGRCVCPEHVERTPSMTVYTDTQTFKCYGIGCSVQGDVIDLVKLAEGCELWEAMMILSARYGIELPPRPPAWFAKQERQREVRAIVDQVRKRVYRRRLFKYLVLPALAHIDDDEYDRELERTWAEFEGLLQ